MNKNIKDSIIEKTRIKIAVSNFEEGESKMPRKNILKLVASFVVTLGVTVGLVYAGGIAYEKIWKEPEAYKIKREVTEEEKNQSITKEEAEKIGNSYLKKINLENEKVKNLELEKEFFSQENIWRVTSDKATIIIDGKTGKLKSINIPTWKREIPNNYGITREEAKKVAYELLEKYKPDNDNGEYELVSLRRNMEKDEEAYIWYADFCKKYGDLINPEEEIFIGWIPNTNDLYCLEINQNPYENNEEKITKEQAIKIVEEKDKQIDSMRKIEKIEADIRIRKMNEEVYLKENFRDEYESGNLNMEKIDENVYKFKEDATLYETEKRVRKVWCVAVEYEKQEDGRLFLYTYYVDCTTGEIIGGNPSDEFLDETIQKEDPNNVM